jgi:hypothetical protein
MLHRLVGAMVLLMWGYAVTHLDHLLPGLAAAMQGMRFPMILLDMLGTALGNGVAVVLLMPLVSAALIGFPKFFADRFSPKSGGISNDPILDEGFWRLMGYFGLIVSLGLLALFRQT